MQKLHAGQSVRLKDVFQEADVICAAEGFKYKNVAARNGAIIQDLFLRPTQKGHLKRQARGVYVLAQPLIGDMVRAIQSVINQFHRPKSYWYTVCYGILEKEGRGAKNVREVKPEHYGAVIAACERVLSKGVYARLAKMLEGHVAIAGPIKNGDPITRAALSHVPCGMWWSFAVNDLKLMNRIAKLREKYDCDRHKAASQRSRKRQKPRMAAIMDTGLQPKMPVHRRYWEAGYRAALANSTVRHCPFTGGPSREWWLIGFKWAGGGIT